MLHANDEHVYSNIRTSERGQFHVQCIMNAIINADAVVGGAQQSQGKLVGFNLLLKDVCMDEGGEGSHQSMVDT